MDLFLQFFYPTLAIISGVLIPVFIYFVFLLLKILAERVLLERELLRERVGVKNLMAEGWYFEETKQPPNPLYITLVFKSRKTRTVLELSAEKKDLKW